MRINRDVPWFRLFTVFVTMTITTTSAMVSVAQSSSRLPMALSTIINDMEAEEIEKVSTACLITSTGVTRKAKAALLEQLFGEGTDEDVTTIGTDSGLAIGLVLSSQDPAQVANTVLACKGTVVYYPDPVDLSRGEGLFGSLAPAIERLLATGTKGSLLVLTSGDASQTKSQLEEAATSILSNIIQKSNAPAAKSLADVFAEVEYVSPSDLEQKLLAGTEGVEPMDAAAAVSSTIDVMSTVLPPLPTGSALNGRDLASARKLGPAARKALDKAIARVRDTADENLTTDFGNLCEAAAKVALEDIPKGKGTTASQIHSQLKEELYSELGDVFNDQMDLLRIAYVEQFNRKVSKVRLSPLLANDMSAIASEVTKDFAKAAKKMVAPGSGWTTGTSQTAFSRELKTFCSEQLLKARASGKFKPVPRKGVTVGFHWLLPKPFGNDYRQEPWELNTGQDLVYVPQDKISEVEGREVYSGDWRRKIRSGPVASEMYYLPAK